MGGGGETARPEEKQRLHSDSGLAGATVAEGGTLGPVKPTCSPGDLRQRGVGPGPPALVVHPPSGPHSLLSSILIFMLPL